MAADETSKTGVFVDRATGKVVTSRPQRARVLVHPGGKITANIKNVIEAYGGMPKAKKASKKSDDV